MTTNKTKTLVPLISIFIVLNVFFLAGKNLLLKNGFDQVVLIIGNLVIFTVTLLSYFISRSSFGHKNPNVFVRSIYKTTMLKLFVIVIAAVIYIFSFKKELNKPALIACMALYIVYTVIEVSALTRLLKEKKNA